MGQKIREAREKGIDLVDCKGVTREFEGIVLK